MLLTATSLPTAQGTTHIGPEQRFVESGWGLQGNTLCDPEITWAALPPQGSKDNLCSAPVPTHHPQSRRICPGPFPSPVCCWARRKANKLLLKKVIPLLGENLHLFFFFKNDLIN